MSAMERPLWFVRLTHPGIGWAERSGRIAINCHVGCDAHGMDLAALDASRRAGRAKHARELDLFVRSVELGDAVVGYDARQPDHLLMGTVIGAYEFRPDLLECEPHQRRVVWQRTTRRNELIGEVGPLPNRGQTYAFSGYTSSIAQRERSRRGDATIEESWLRYAWRVVSDRDHRTDCAARGGSPVGDPRVVADLRWPGYLGPDYQAGGVLWLNIVHADLAQNGAVEAAGVIVAANRAWADGSISDQTYLHQTQQGYLKAFENWRVGRAMQPVLTALGRSHSSIAYANAARCQVMPDGGHGARQTRLVGLCQAWLPISELVDALRPGLVYATATALGPALEHLPGDPLVVIRSQRHKQSSYGWQPPVDGAWLEALASDYGRRSHPPASGRARQ